MNFMQKPFQRRLVLATGIFTLLLPAWAPGQAASEKAADKSPEKAHALLDEVKKSDLERQIAAKQTEIQHLKEDQEKTERDTGGLQKTIDSNTALITDSTDNLTKLGDETKRLQREVAVHEARIVAEREKIEGLRALSAAQAKSLDALNLHLEESDARTKVQTAEMELLRNGRVVPVEGREEKSENDLAKSRKALSLAIGKTQAAQRLAREAMNAAAAKVALVDAREAAVQRLAEADPAAPVPPPEKPKRRTVERSAPSPTAPAPVASSPKPAPKGTPAPKAPAATPKPSTGFFGR